MICRICSGTGTTWLHYDEERKQYVPLLCLSCMGTGIVERGRTAWERAQEEVHALYRDFGGES